MATNITNPLSDRTQFSASPAAVGRRLAICLTDVQTGTSVYLSVDDLQKALDEARAVYKRA